MTNPPREPTPEMMNGVRGWKILDEVKRNLWRAMYDAWAAQAAPAGDAAVAALIARCLEWGTGEWTWKSDTHHMPDRSPFWDLQEAAAALASAQREIEFLHKRRGELVIERDRYKAALGQYPEGRDVMLGGALAEIETQRDRATKAEAERDAMRALLLRIESEGYIRGKNGRTMHDLIDAAIAKDGRA